MLLSTKGIALLSILGISLLCAQSSIAQAIDLLISEYVEGSSNNKYIEIFNGTGSSVDLSNYEIRLYSNGNSSPNVTNSLSGILADGSTIVYSNSSATVYGGTTTDLGVTSFNGDDALELYNSTTGTTVDIFGVIGCDPGSQWISASNRTQNRTLRRNANVLSGVTSNPACTSSSGDFTTLEAEWTEFPQNNVADLGSHSIVVNNAPEVDLGPDQTICSGSSITLFSGGDGTTFLWSTGETTENITVSAAGTYTVTVTNAFGSTSDDINISFFPPTDLFVTSPTICLGETAEICATVGTDDLIISEYIEGSGLNKCIEIYNGTGASIDLASEGYTLDITFNGGSSTASIPLSGVIDNGATHVICDNNADAGFLAEADQTTNANLYNGDDAVVLSKAGIAVDIFGVINSDPGAQWSAGGNSTQNSTLVRNATVTGGITTNPTGTGGSAFATLGTEWTEGTFDDPSGLGSHTVTGTGTFSWSTGATALCTSVTPASTTDYTFSYLDTDGCTTDITSTVTVSDVTVTAVATSILCNGGTADVTVSATGGVAPYTGVGTFSETAGTYTYTVTDANGCSGTATITITEPTPIVAYTSCPEILCNGGTQQMAVFAFGGTAPYTGGGLFTVGAGTYFYTLTDANGCTDTITHVVTEPPVTVVASATATPIDCNGGTSTVTVSATGGVSPYSGTGMFTVPAGTQSFTVTDGDGCTSTATVTITEPTALVATATGSILCNGGSGDITVTATGGTAPYSGTGIFTETAGTYTYTITDANGCSTTVTYTLTEPAAVVVSVTATTIDCNGGSADVTVSATGGSAPYSGIGVLSETAGTYTYTVTDANGCSATGSITITEPAMLVASSTAGSILYNGGTADVVVTATGGTAPYSGTGTFNEAAGTYTYTVTDANGCTATTSVTLTEPTALVASSTAGTILCNGGTANIVVTATGGTAPYSGTGTFNEAAGTYMYTVTDANGCTATTSVTLSEPAILVVSATAGTILCNGGTTDVVVAATGGTASSSGTGTFNVSAGTYDYTVTDANGCSETVSITVTEPAALVASATAGTIVCNGGSADIVVTASGGTAPYSGTGTFNEMAGTYNYTITDANGCTVTTSATLTEPSAVVVSATAGTILCNGGTTDVVVSATGGTPSYTGTGTFTETAGTYTYSVSDANGCTGSASVTITEPAPLVATATVGFFNFLTGTADVTITATGGTTPYTGTGVFAQPSGIVTYTVTDANGCTTTVTAIVSGGIDGFIVYPNPVISGDGLVWVSLDVEVETDMTIRIQHLSGRVVYQEVSHVEAGELQKSISVQGYPRGSYFIEVETNRINQKQQLVVQ